MRYYKFPVFIKFLNWTCCSCSCSPLYLDHAIQGSTVIALYNVHAIFKWFTVLIKLYLKIDYIVYNKIWTIGIEFEQKYIGISFMFLAVEHLKSALHYK